MKTRNYVTAWYNEDVDIKRLVTHYKNDLYRHQEIFRFNFVSKGEERIFKHPEYVDYVMPNIGRESSSWLLWIINNYYNLPEYCTFLQGNPLDHTTLEDISLPMVSEEIQYRRHGQLLECNVNGAPHHSGLNLKIPAQIMGIDLPPLIQFCMGAQFTVSKEILLRYSYQQYVALFNYSIQESNAPWELERLWETFYNLPA